MSGITAFLGCQEGYGTLYVVGKCPELRGLYGTGTLYVVFRV